MGHGQEPGTGRGGSFGWLGLAVTQSLVFLGLGSTFSTHSCFPAASPCSEAGATGRLRGRRSGGCSWRGLRQLEQRIDWALWENKRCFHLRRLCRKGNLTQPVHLPRTTGTIVLVALVELSLTLPAAGAGRTLGQELGEAVMISVKAVSALVPSCSLAVSGLCWHCHTGAPLGSMRTHPWPRQPLLPSQQHPGCSHGNWLSPSLRVWGAVLEKRCLYVSHLWF